MWFGRLVPEKAPHEAVAIAAASGRRVRLAGPISNEAYFADAVRPMLGPSAEYVGHLQGSASGSWSAPAPPPWSPRAWEEPYGLVAAGVAGCGTPVLAYDRGGLGEFLRPGVRRPGRRRGTCRLRPQPSTRSVAKERSMCRDHALQHCSLERMIDAYLGVYEAVAPLGLAA